MTPKKLASKGCIPTILPALQAWKTKGAQKKQGGKYEGTDLGMWEKIESGSHGYALFGKYPLLFVPT